jgi:hypothetical protein
MSTRITSSKPARPAAKSVKPGARETERGRIRQSAARQIDQHDLLAAASARAILIASCVASICSVARTRARPAALVFRCGEDVIEHALKRFQYRADLDFADLGCRQSP